MDWQKAAECGKHWQVASIMAPLQVNPIKQKNIHRHFKSLSAGLKRKMIPSGISAAAQQILLFCVVKT
jgi:hypothetical protein